MPRLQPLPLFEHGIRLASSRVFVPDIRFSDANFPAQIVEDSSFQAVEVHRSSSFQNSCTGLAVELCMAVHKANQSLVRA